jgi:uncharacterized protein YggE
MSRSVFPLLLCCLPLVSQLAAEENATTATLTSPGYGQVAVTAERLRMAIPLFAHALTADEAIELLRTRKANARERCLALQAVAESIRFVGLSVESNDPVRGSNYSIVQRMNAMGNPIDPDDIPSLVTARVDMTVDWVLPNGDGESLLALAEDLRESLRDPDVTGKDERPEFAPRIEEAIEAMQNQTRVYSSRGSRSQQEEIRYAFVAELTPQIVAAAYQQASDDARQAVEAMAAAAGLKLLRMTSMSSNRQYSSSRSYSSSSGRTRVDPLRADEKEVIGSSIDALEYSIRLHVQYAVQQ